MLEHAMDQVRMLVFGAGTLVLAWKAIEMVMKERFSTAIPMGIAALLFAGFTFGGTGLFRALWCALAGILGLSC